MADNGGPIVIVEQCHGRTAKGQRCKRRSQKSGMCWTHLQKEQGLRVKKSQVEDAGDGLYAMKEFRRGNDITEYGGDRVVLDAEGNNIETGRPWVSQYGLQIRQRPPTFIDARKTNSAPGRWANTARGSEFRNNSQLVYNSRGRKAHVRATKTIEPGEEIFVPYGPGFRIPRGSQ